MSLDPKPTLRKLLSGNRAVVDVTGFYRVQFMPSGRILRELETKEDAEEFCKTLNRHAKYGGGVVEQAFAIPYEEIFAENIRAMKRLGKRPRKHKQRADR